MTGSLTTDDARANARLRAAHTKRTRTRRALLEAAGALLVERGWHATRMEDVASRAGVSSATTYNHFPTKPLLVAHVYAPLLESPFAEVRRLVDRDVPVVDVITAHVHDLAATVRAHEALAVAMQWAVQEYGSQVGGPADPGSADADADPRLVAPMPQMLLELIERGQDEGALRPFPSATDMAALTANMLLQRGSARRGEPAPLTAEIGLTALFGSLRPQALVEAGESGRPFAVRPAV